MDCDYFKRKTASYSESIKQILLIILGDYYLCPACKQIHHTEVLKDGEKNKS